jgi:hypothetical protein
MPDGSRSDDEIENNDLTTSNAFLDTSVLQNYIQRDLEGDKSSHLIESTDFEVHIGQTVKEEIENVRDRRDHIYEDLVDFLLEEDGQFTEYEPANRRAYFDDNDASHIREIQYHFSQLDERAEIQRQLRRFMRAVKRRLEALFETLIPDYLFEDQPGLTLMFSLSDVIEHDDDRDVVGDAALWAAEGDGSSGILSTLDKDHLLDAQAEINDVLVTERNEAWTIEIVTPDALNVDANGSP